MDNNEHDEGHWLHRTIREGRAVTALLPIAKIRTHLTGEIVEIPLASHS